MLLEQHFAPGTSKKILALDGGGIRGVKRIIPQWVVKYLGQTKLMESIGNI